jgi:hypothetical protein
MFDRLQETKRIEIRRKIAPASIALKYPLVLGASLYRGSPYPPVGKNELCRVERNILSNLRQVRPPGANLARHDQ